MFIQAASIDESVMIWDYWVDMIVWQASGQRASVSLLNLELPQMPFRFHFNQVQFFRFLVLACRFSHRDYCGCAAVHAYHKPST